MKCIILYNSRVHFSCGGQGAPYVQGGVRPVPWWVDRTPADRGHSRGRDGRHVKYGACPGRLVNHFQLNFRLSK